MRLTFLKLNTKQQLKKNHTHRVGTTYTNAHRVGIVFTTETRAKHDAIKEMVKKIEADGKTVTVMVFLPDKKENYEFLFDYFTIKDISFWGGLQSVGALKFSNTPFDYLFCIDENPDHVILNMLARSKAKCRIGKYKEGNEPYFELMIDSKEGIAQLIEGALQYTKKLR